MRPATLGKASEEGVDQQLAGAASRKNRPHLGAASALRSFPDPPYPGKRAHKVNSTGKMMGIRLLPPQGLDEQKYGFHPVLVLWSKR